MHATEIADPPGGPASSWRTVTLGILAMAVVVVLALLVLTLGEANRQRDAALASQRHSYDVMIMVRTLQGTIADAEASLGRYVISGDQQLGRAYYEDWRRADQAIDRLTLLTSDNRAHAHHMADLRAAFDTRGHELALTALSTNYGKNSQALARFYQARKAASLGRISIALDDMIRRERMLLEERTTQARASVHRSTTIATVLAVFGILLLGGAIALGWVMVNVMTDRAVVQTEADTERERADELAMAVSRATAELQAQEERLRQVQKMEAVGQLTGGIAHDFNNMLAVMLSGIELAARHLPPDADTAARHLASAHDGAVRAAALTRRLLAFARERALNVEAVDAAALIAGIDDLIDRTLGDGVTVVFEDGSAGWRTRVDRAQLENILVNLSVNARDAMGGRGTLTIRAARTTIAGDDFVALAVADTGCGIAPELIDRVFEPFFTTKPVGQGTGLGLSQTFAFARAVGGDVTIASAPGHGTTVTLLLPRDATAGDATQDATLADSPPFPTIGRPARACSVLVVEDDLRVLPATVAALAELGHRPVACDDPTRAADVLAGMASVDLILSDVLMPGLTGPEMIAALGSHASAIPVLFVTGFAGGTDGGIALGGRPVLRKPFTLSALDRAVRAAARRGGATALAAE